MNCLAGSFNFYDTCDNRSLLLDCVSCKCQKSRRNSHCLVVVPIYFNKNSDNEQDSPISHKQGNLTFEKIFKCYKTVDTSDCGISWSYWLAFYCKMWQNAMPQKNMILFDGSDYSHKNSKWVWSGNTTITNCRQPRGTVRKSRSTITRHQENKLSKAISSLFPIKMIAILEWT